MAKKEAKKEVTAPKAKVLKPKNGVQYNQSEFYESLMTATGLENKRITKDVYAAFAGLIVAALKKGYKVPLPGIGKIQVRQSKARTGRNPATGAIIQIAAKKRVRLSPSKVLKEAVL
jgi:DNA-binding protein HU-beta